MGNEFKLMNTDLEALDPIRKDIQRIQADLSRLTDAVTGLCLALEEKLGIQILDPEQLDEGDQDG